MAVPLQRYLRCNIAIDRIAALETQETETRDRLVAEARFLRGYYYFELVRNFGGVPLMTSFQMPEEVEGTERATAEAVYKFIEDDLMAAVEILPQRLDCASRACYPWRRFRIIG